jgi:hypothetical protein
MSIDFEREVGTALHATADRLDPPPLHLDRIRRAGRRRRARAATTAVLGTAIVAAGIAAGGVKLFDQARSAHVPQSSRVGASRPLPTTRPAGTRFAEVATAMANVQVFYTRYETARRQGPGAVDALIRAHVVSWYRPILEAPPGWSVDPVECGVRGGASNLDYQPVGVAGGQAVIVVGSRLAGAARASYGIVTAEPSTGKITGITCSTSIAGNDVTRTDARNATTSLYRTYVPARRQGASVHDALARLVAGGSSLASPYLWQAEYAVSHRLVAYDPLLCASTIIPSMSVGPATIVASGSAGMVVVTPGHGQSILAVTVLGAKGLTVADVACRQP